MLRLKFGHGCPYDTPKLAFSPRGALLPRLTFSFAAHRSSHTHRHWENRLLHFHRRNHRPALPRAPLVVRPPSRTLLPNRNLHGAVLRLVFSCRHVLSVSCSGREFSESSALRRADQLRSFPDLCSSGSPVQCPHRSRRAFSSHAGIRGSSCFRGTHSRHHLPVFVFSVSPFRRGNVRWT